MDDGGLSTWNRRALLLPVRVLVSSESDPLCIKNQTVTRTSSEAFASSQLHTRTDKSCCLAHRIIRPRSPVLKDVINVHHQSGQGSRSARPKRTAVRPQHQSPVLWWFFHLSCVPCWQGWSDPRTSTRVRVLPPSPELRAPGTSTSMSHRMGPH